MPEQPRRKKGGQPGNSNALRSGYHTAAAKEARWRAWQAILQAYKPSDTTAALGADEAAVSTDQKP